MSRASSIEIANPAVEVLVGAAPACGLDGARGGDGHAARRASDETATLLSNFPHVCIAGSFISLGRHRSGESTYSGHSGAPDKLMVGSGPLRANGRIYES